MPKGSKKSKKPCKGTMYVMNGKKWCVGENLVKKSKKSRRAGGGKSRRLPKKSRK